jgi:hypothetical protein
VLAVFLTLSLASCASKPAASPCYPPTVYLQEVSEPIMRGNTNNDLILWTLDLREALKLANSDKKALRDWADTRLNDSH